MINQVSWKHFLYPSTKFFSDLRLSKLPVVMFCSLHTKESCACGTLSAKTTLLKMTCQNILVKSGFIILLFSVTFILKKNILIHYQKKNQIAWLNRWEALIKSWQAFLGAAFCHPQTGERSVEGQPEVCPGHVPVAWDQHSTHFMYGGYSSFTLK